MKKFHDSLKTIYGPKSSGATPLISADGSTLLTDKDAIFKMYRYRVCTLQSFSVFLLIGNINCFLY